MDVGKLPGLLEKEFVIGFVIPAVVALLEAYMVWTHFFREPEWLAALSFEKAAGLASVGFVVWFSALALMGLNQLILIILSGYPVRWLARWLGVMWLIRKYRAWRFKETIELQKRISEARRNGTTEPEAPITHGAKLIKARSEFPSQDGDLLPTPFGNWYRAMQETPYFVYGLDSTKVWPRMESILPDDHRKLVAEAKSVLNFCVNLYFTTAVALVCYLAGKWVYEEQDHVLNRLLVALVVTMILSRLASLYAIKRYGEYVTGAFDLYRGKLADTLGLEIPRDPQEEREMWKEVSRTFVYQSADAYERLTSYKKSS